MSTKTQNSSPFSRLSRRGLGLGAKPNTRPRDSAGESGVDDEWYIPYNGPYEAPREPLKRLKERDSWGDPLYGDEEDDTALASRELQKLYGVGPVDGNELGQFSGDVYGDHARNSRPRDRTQSGVSGRTVSSGAVDPSRASFGTQRRSTISSSPRPPVPSYINLDAAGGVGESPVPQTRLSREPSVSNRVSIASIFTFGIPNRKGLSSPKRTDGNVSRFSRKISRSGRPSSNGPVASPHRRSSSSGSYSYQQNTLRTSRVTNLSPINGHGAEVPNDEDYYNSYYSTLISPGESSSKPAQLLQPPTPSTASISSTSQHPYAYVFPTSQADGPQTAPMSSSNAQSHHEPPRLTFTAAPKSHNLDNSQLYLRRPLAKSLKNSVSTPDLRLASGSNKKLPPKPSLFPKGKERWLSAETWCDALLFPRPRLKVKQEGASGYVGSGRIVSPPGSPIQQSFSDSVAHQEIGMVSRVLAHSRSLVDLAKAAEAPPDKPVLGGRPPVILTTQTGSHRNGIPATLRPPRPRSFAQDDLALPSPVPSLARVLEEGQTLNDQRKDWQTQATQSFQNKRMRSVSRARSKSLTQKGKRMDETPPSNFDFLAARSLLGNQAVMPIIVTPETSVSHATSSGGTFSRTSHSHSNSLSKTLSKSSKSHSHGHSRTDSWGRSALKLAKTATCGMTGVDSSILDSSEETGSGLESALKRDGTKIIRLADPALITVDKGLSAYTTPQTSSPTPSGSGVSDSRIGIALSTPPLADDGADRDSIHLVAHPYAQGGGYNYTSAAESHSEKGSDYAGPHPSMTTASQPMRNLDVSSRHRLPPQAASHPYAQVSTPDLYTDVKKIVREDSDVPPPAKMWAQFSPGVLREVLPKDIQYSPFMSESGQESSRNSKIINDTVGVGEALAYAVRPTASKDSGLGTSEDYEAQLGQQPVAGSSGLGKRSYRQPVQYDATRPSYLSQAQKSSDPSSAHTFASSPLVPPPTPPPFIRDGSLGIEDFRGTSISPGMTSENSSPPHSPHSFGSPDDLEGYRDLFFKPSTQYMEQSFDANTMGSVPTSWDANSRSRRTGSGLTSLARQLSAEFEQMALERERESSVYSRDSIPMAPRAAFVRRPTDASLEFVFEETSQFGSRGGSASPPDHSTLSAFHPSINIPEDVESSRASSPIDPHEDVTARYRVGVVESVSTPPAISSDRRESQMGQMFVEDQIQPAPVPRDSSQSGVHSSLQPPSAGLTRSSYMTTSTGSYISGLSDFPAPPRQYATHMSLLSSYFDEALSQSEARVSRSPTPPIPADGHIRRLTFGGDEEIEELVAALSSHHSHSSHS
ncbi:hypothetical protein BDZ94DRAFT_1272786 [Collybia nuda]|uniref:Uncharacterized protein n=1 Tax=Collybia nuda TaxID=64659 RepID=A0A9P6C9R3_9AGAR|nr:hypothetical protein BDZ94DRAFT_1272786 [Collybia nuda]